MNVTLPAGKRAASMPLLLALLGVVAIAIVVAWTSEGGLGSEQAASRAIPAVTSAVLPASPESSLTMILVASQEEADYLQMLRTEAHGLVNSGPSNDQVEIIVVSTPEQAERAMESIRVTRDALAYDPTMSFHVVDVRDVSLLPR